MSKNISGSVLLIVLVIIGGWYLIKNQAIQTKNTLNLLSAPALNYSTGGNGAKPFVQININYTCDKTYNFYRSTDATNWTKLFTVDFKTFSRGPSGPNGEETFGCSSGGQMDENF